MKHIRSFVVVTVLGAICVDACAQVQYVSRAQRIKRDAPKGISNAFYACLEKTESDSIARAACLSAERDVQDNRLNAVYKSVLGKLNGPEKDAMVNAERSWLEFHQKSEELETSLYGGKSNSVAVSVSAFDTTLHEIFRLCERANTLDTYLHLASNQ